MRPDLERIQLLEDYLHNRLDPQRTADLQARLLLDEELRTDLEVQRQLYQAIRASGRQRLRQELETIHEQLYGRGRYTWLAPLLLTLLGIAACLWWQ